MLGPITGGPEPLYFGPLAGYDTEELDRRGLNQDKKTAKGFKWFSKKKPSTNINSQVATTTTKNILPGPPTPAWDDPPPTPDVGQGKKQEQPPGYNNKDSEDVPTWDEFTQTTTFHGVRYIFDKTPFRIRR